MVLRLKTSFLILATMLTSLSYAASHNPFHDRLGALYMMRHGDGSGSFARSHNPTPDQPKGPFYPITKPMEHDQNLFLFNGKKAFGTKVHLQGIVKDLDGNSLDGVKIEIWQACATGKYNHEYDPNPAPADLNFQYYGISTTGENGSYSFDTIVPGPYLANERTGWVRPPHIHFFIQKEGFEPLITQLYFSGESLGKDEVLCYQVKEDVTGSDIDALNKKERFLSELSEEDKKALIVAFPKVKISGLNEKGVKQTVVIRSGTFNIFLKPTEKL